MAFNPSRREIAIRLLLSIVAGAAFGFNRTEHGRPAGLRTTILVCLAASVSMIQADLLLNTTGKAGGSFAVADVLRLPLGILSGMGFIGAGAIVRRGDFVLGVTTAATLWFVTTMGLCFGGGAIGLGLAALVLGLGTLWGLRRLEDSLPRDHRAVLEVCFEPGAVEQKLRSALGVAGLHVVAEAIHHNAAERELIWTVAWRSPPVPAPPPLIGEITGWPEVRRIAWRPQGPA